MTLQFFFATTHRTNLATNKYCLMVLRIRLARWGARNNPFYGIVVAQLRKARDGKHIERLGSYDPVGKEKQVELNVDRIKYWLSVGAQPSERVNWLLAKAGILPPSPTHLHNVGLLDLSDRNTWPVEVNGNVFDAMDFKKPEPKPIVRLTYKDINLEHKATKPLSGKDALFALKTYLGV